MFKSATRIYIDTGNLTEWNRLGGRFSQSSENELRNCLDGTLASWNKSVNFEDYKSQKIISCHHQQFTSKVDKDEDNFDIYVKVFAIRGQGENVDDAVNRAISELGVNHVNSVSLSLPESVVNFNSEIKEMWQVLEQFVIDGKIKEIGVCDLQSDDFSQLYEWSKVKPAYDSVNLSTCCVIPPELVAFAKEHKLKLLTHADRRDILTKEDLQKTLDNYFVEDSNAWYPCWVARYTVLIKHRGVIHSKGYLTRCDRIEGNL